MKSGSWLMLGLLGLGAFFLFKKSKDPETKQEVSIPTGTPTLAGYDYSTPTSIQQMQNIADTYGKEFALTLKNLEEQSKNAGDLFNKIKAQGEEERQKTIRAIDEKYNLSVPDLVQQTSLKSGGGGSGLRDGKYNISGLGSVTVKSVPKEQSIAYKKGYIR